MSLMNLIGEAGEKISLNAIRLNPRIEKTETVDLFGCLRWFEGKIGRPVNDASDFLAKHENSIYRLEMVPDFQRGRVWSKKQQAEYLGHLLEGGAAGVVVFNVLGGDLETGLYQCVDGLQRLISMMEWRMNKLPAVLTDGRKVMYGDIETPRLLRGIEFRVDYTSLTREQALTFYIRLNSSGTPHSAEELDRVRALIPKNSSHV